MTDRRGGEATEVFPVRAYRAGDEGAINAGFNAVFGRERPLAEWAWKFADGPRGRFIALAADAGGRVLSHFSAVPVEVQLAGRRLLAGQSVDDYCRQRSGLGRRGLYVSTVEWFYRHAGRPDGLAFLFGFPGERHLRLGRALLGYLEPTPVRCLTRSLEPAAESGRGDSKPQVARDPELGEVGRLWSRCADRYPYAVVRDAEWLTRRYRGRPGVEYHGLAVRRWGRLRAWCVVRCEGALLRWADLIWDGGDARDLAALDRATATLGRDLGARSAEMWLVGDRAATAALVALGWAAAGHPQQLGLTAVPLVAGVDLAPALRGFYFTLGDSDLV